MCRNPFARRYAFRSLGCIDRQKKIWLVSFRFFQLHQNMIGLLCVIPRPNASQENPCGMLLFLPWVYSEARCSNGRQSLVTPLEPETIAVQLLLSRRRHMTLWDPHVAAKKATSPVLSRVKRLKKKCSILRIAAILRVRRKGSLGYGSTRRHAARGHGVTSSCCELTPDG